MAWAPDYATLVEVKAYLRIPADDTADDTLIPPMITSASRNIDRFANRQFGIVAAPVQRFYTAEWNHERTVRSVEIDDLMTVTGLVVEFDSAGDGTFAEEITGVVPRPANAPADGRPWTSLRMPRGSAVTGAEDAVRVTASFGWTVTPVAIKEACLLQTSRYWARRDAPFGVAGSPELGSEMRLLNKLDPDVEVAVKPYWRLWGAA